jgi:hypothetical protein
MIGRSVLSFARGSGLSLIPTGVIEGTEYTIEVLFRFDRVDGYRKIIDFSDGSDDHGVYVLDGCVNVYPRHMRSSIPIQADSYVQVVLTRDSSSGVVGYVNGIRQFAFPDTGALAEVASETLRFFVDDSVTGGEGVLERSRVADPPVRSSTHRPRGRGARLRRDPRPTCHGPVPRSPVTSASFSARQEPGPQARRS